MKLTYNWLKDFVKISLSPEALAEKLTMAGLEVKNIEPKDGDFVFEIEITSNRPDWLSVAGVAREVAAITNSKWRAYSVKRMAYSQNLSAKRYSLNAKTLKINVENKKDCPLYTATIIEDVKIAPSPEWMQKRLAAVGLRPVNNVVDITNYILYETGQPMHAFDLDRLIGHQGIRAPGHRLEIGVRRAKKGEEIVTIDGIKRILNENILVIADADKPIAIAGIIGGKDTEVGNGTTNILLESAQFDPLVVRRAARTLGISSDSSYRFERKVDSEGVSIAAQRAAQLIIELAGGKVSFKSQRVKESKSQRKKITLSIGKTERILGAKIPAAKIKQILSSLGFKLAACSVQHVAVFVPSFRQDINIEEDLIEEIARIYGYDKLSSTQPRILSQFIDPGSLIYLKENYLPDRLKNQIKNVLTGLGFYEVINYSLMRKDALGKTQDSGMIEVANPLSKEQEALRANLFGGLLANLAYNVNHRNTDVKIFELGNIFSLDNKLTERWALGLAVCGRLRFDWQRQDKNNATIYDLKGAVECLLLKLGIENVKFSSSNSPLFKNGACFSVDFLGKRQGIIGEANNEILANYSIKEKGIFLAQLALDGLGGIICRKIFKPYSPYPVARRDISLVVKKQIAYKDIETAILSSAGNSASVKLSEQYTGKPIPDGFKNLLLSLEYGFFERTFKDEEVDALHKQVISGLIVSLDAQIR